MPCVMAANPRRSSAKLPMMNSENANTAESSGDENDENSRAREQRIRNSRTMKYKATKIKASGEENLWATYNKAANTPMAMKNVFTTSVPANPRNFPTMNSQRRTGRDRTVYNVLFSISLETSPIPMKMVMTTPNRETAVRPRFTTTRRSISMEIWPIKIAAPESSNAKAIRLYKTRSRTASRNVLEAM